MPETDKIGLGKPSLVGDDYLLEKHPTHDDIRTLELADFAGLFGTTIDDLPGESLQLIKKHDFSYRVLRGEEHDDVVLSVLKRLNSEELTVAGDESARGRWERGWSENLKNLSRNNFDPSALIPKYMKPGQAVRLNQTYAMPENSQFEYNWYKVFTSWLFRKYLSKLDAIYEFGCGSGLNIAILAQMFPGKKIVGLDWALSSKKIIGRLAKAKRWNVEGRVFDFFKPDRNLKLVENSAVLTIGALEQTGRKYESFLKFLLNASPTICINIEPICEWYDETVLMDYLAVLFHRRRGYWENFPNTLKGLEANGKVEILKTKRSFFGSLFIEGFSQTIWRPSGKR